MVGMLFDPKQWYPSPNREIHPSPWFIPLAQAAFIFSTMLPRGARIKIAAPILLLFASQTRAVSTGDAVRDFSRASFMFGFVVRFIDFGMLVKDGDVFKINDGKSHETRPNRSSHQEKNLFKIEAKELWQRFKDSLEIWLFNLRGINWNWEVGGIPKRKTQSRKYFIFRTALRIFGTCLAWDLCKHAMGHFLYIQNTTRASFFAQPILNQVALTWLHQLEAFSFINLPYQLAALITVGFGFQDPDDWPPLFGKLSDAYLVSRAWGRTWHQLLRRSLGILTPYMQKWLGVSSRSSKRSVSVMCSFILSGFVHWSGALNVPWTPSSHGMFTYFIMQAPVIRAEDYIKEWGEKKGIRDNLPLRILGYVWTVGWISFSMRYAAAFQFETGALSRHEPLKYSVIGLFYDAKTAR